MRLPQSVCTRANLRRRRSFTLVELILVLAIILTLIGLLIPAAMKLITTQHERNTKFMMTQLYGALNKHWTAVAEQAQTENWNANPTALATIQGWAAGDGTRSRVMYVKFREKQEFPTTYAEALNPYPMSAKASYAAYLSKFGITSAYVSSSSYTPQPYESSACLYMAMTLATGATKIKVDQLGLAVREFPAPSGTIKAFTDDWGNPLVFCRWPTGDPNLPNLCPMQNTSLLDKDDPFGRITDANWQSQYPAGVAAFQQYGHLITQSGQPQAYYLIPVIVSAGRDGLVGLNADFSVNTSAVNSFNKPAVNDNIYIYNSSVFTYPFTTPNY